ncbi:MAG: hypothetical protein O2U61_03645 [Candidatus Bathyarchaeota archaeon]|nr:hypothetical protein [Candidatus Bathyarchaeota archaeon]
MIINFIYKSKNKLKNPLISSLRPNFCLFLNLNAYIQVVWRPILEVIAMSEEEWEWEDEEEDEDEDW